MKQDATATHKAELSAVITRCGCGHGDTHPTSPCPKPGKVEDLGVIARPQVSGTLLHKLRTLWPKPNQ